MGNLNVVAVMIVRNEADNLPHLFASAKGLVDEWMVLDTGSTDGTVGVATELGATVVEDPWDDDFARSRNLAVWEAETRFPDAEWFLQLDGDERVVHPEAIAAELQHFPGPIAGVHVVSPTVEGGMEPNLQARLWREAAGLRYHLPVHACLDLSVLRDKEGRVHLPPVKSGWIHHEGYATEDGRRENALRTLRICSTKLPADDPHRLISECRALVALQSWPEAAERGMKLITEWRGRAGEEGIPSVLPYLFTARALLLQGDVENSTLLLAECIQKGGGEDAGTWGNLLQNAAFGLMATSIQALRGGGDPSSHVYQSHDILKALNQTGVLALGIQDEILDELRTYKELCNLQSDLAWALPQEALNEIQKRAPGGVAVELGSGSTTTHLVKHFDRVYSVEHDPAFLNPVETGSAYIYAPLQDLPGGERVWYSRNAVEALLPNSFDFLLIDGPPGVFGRKGLLYHLDLFKSLNSAMILVDDTNRQAEKELVEALEEYTGRTAVHHLAPSRGTAFSVFP